MRSIKKIYDVVNNIHITIMKEPQMDIEHKRLSLSLTVKELHFFNNHKTTDYFNNYKIKRNNV